MSAPDGCDDGPENGVPMKLPLVLAEMTVLQVRQALERIKSAILPIGCVEQHGYHLPTGTDSLTAEYVCRRVAELRPVILLPTQHYSFSGGMLEGTVQIKPPTVGLIAGEILESLYGQGFRGVTMISGHGGGRHVAAIRSAISAVTEATEDYYIAFACIGSSLSPSARGVLRPDRRDANHATEVETSMIQHIAPALVREEMLGQWEDREALHDPIDETDRYIERLVQSSDRAFDEKVKIGVGSCPRPAKDNYGGRILDECVDSVVKIVDRIGELTQ